ncbi:MAG: hypothetical protein K9K76_10740 [Halanaerobiales bacterium]|nr:hypothetical protein [Halanaerobiales bacterium]
MKIKTIGLFLIVFALVLTPMVEAQDTVSSASRATDEESLMTALGEEGAWIVIIQQDLSTDQDLVLEGEFTNDDETVREIALYTSDENHNVDERYTLTAPKLTVKSPNSVLAAGTFKGDVYVESNNFTLEDGFTVDGNVYFQSEEAKSTFKIKGGATVTGDLVLE